MTWQMLHAIFSFIQSSVNHPSKQNALFLKSSDDIIDRQGVEGEFKGLYYFRLSYPGRGGKGGGVTWFNFRWEYAAGLAVTLPHYSLFCGQTDTPPY